MQKEGSYPNWPSPLPYYNDLHRYRFDGIRGTDIFKLDTTFKLRDQKWEKYYGPWGGNVPLRRFEVINKKIRPLPIEERLITLQNFNDGRGPVYSYIWKNRPEDQGKIGYNTRFDVDANITIDIDSVVGSSCTLFAKNGQITIKRSKVTNCEIYATGSITIDLSELNNVIIYGEGTIYKTKSKDANRVRLRGPFSIVDCEFKKTATVIYYNPPELGLGPASFFKTQFEEKLDIEGNPSISNCEFKGKGIQISSYGNGCTISNCKVTGNAHIFGQVNVVQSELGENCVLTQKCTVMKGQISGDAFIGGNATLEKCQVNGTAIVIGDTVATNSIFSGGVVTAQNNCKSAIISGKALVTGSSSIIGGIVSGSGIVGGSGTSVVSDIKGIVCNGVACTHSVPEGQSHWDDRSCVVTMKNYLIDERKDNTEPGKSDAKQDAPPSIV